MKFQLKKMHADQEKMYIDFLCVVENYDDQKVVESSLEDPKNLFNEVVGEFDRMFFNDGIIEQDWDLEFFVEEGKPCVRLHILHIDGVDAY